MMNREPLRGGEWPDHFDDECKGADDFDFNSQVVQRRFHGSHRNLADLEDPSKYCPRNLCRICDGNAVPGDDVCFDCSRGD